MTTNISEVGRQDRAFLRGSDEKQGARWQLRDPDTGALSPKNLLDWTATFSMECLGETVYSTECTCTSDGLAMAEIPGSTFTGQEWDVRLMGTWQIVARGPDGERRVLGHGYYRIV